MTRTTIMLPEEVKDRAERMARDTGISFSEFVRQAIARSLEVGMGDAARVRRAADPLFVAVGRLRLRAHPSPADGALAHDDYLYGEGRS